MFLAVEYRQINLKADLSMHDVVNRHDFRSSMKSMQNTNPSQEKVSSVYNGKEPSQEKVLSVYTMDKSPPKRRF